MTDYQFGVPRTPSEDAIREDYFSEQVYATRRCLTVKLNGACSVGPIGHLHLGGEAARQLLPRYGANDILPNGEWGRICMYLQGGRL